MHRYGLVVGIVAVALMVGGCASTKMRSFVDPDFKGRLYESILIAAQFPNLDQKAEAEDIFVKKFADLEIACARSVDMLPPTRKYDDADIFDILKKQNIQAVIFVRETDYYEEEVYIPASSTTDTTANLSATTFYRRNSASTFGTGYATSHTTHRGGYYVRKPRIRHQVELYDVTTRRMAWVGSAFTKGNTRARFKHLIKSLAKKTAKRLEEDGFARKQQNDQPPDASALILRSTCTP